MSFKIVMNCHFVAIAQNAVKDMLSCIIFVFLGGIQIVFARVSIPLPFAHVPSGATFSVLD